MWFLFVVLVMYLFISFSEIIIFHIIIILYFGFMQLVERLSGISQIRKPKSVSFSNHPIHCYYFRSMKPQHFLSFRLCLVHLKFSDLNLSNLIWTYFFWFDLIWTYFFWSDLIWYDLIWSDLIWTDLQDLIFYKIYYYYYIITL